MKKLIASKPFIAGTLAVLCISILSVCVLWGKGDNAVFLPDEPVPLAGIDSWTENGIPGTGTTDTAGNYSAWQPPGRQAENPLDEYPKVVEENKNEVMIDFTDPQPRKESPPAIPDIEQRTVRDDPSAMPNPASGSEGTTPHGNSGSSTPTPGSINDKGEFYDPVFGWVKPGRVEQTEIDSPGDPNKMVGSMN